MAKSFLEYDIDDGRSSKLCQNLDDDEYYGQLEVEYNSNIHRTTDLSKLDLSYNKKSIVSEKDLTESLIKNLHVLELSLRLVF